MYAINLISLDNHNINHYGYWSGKQYKHLGEYYPICQGVITTETKLFKSEKVAINSAEKCLYRYSYVSKYEIVEVNPTYETT